MSTNKEIIFVWTGKNKQGKPIKGEIKAINIAAARLSLRNKGVYIQKIKKRPLSIFAKKISKEDIAVITRQLATMLRAGVPLLQSFDIVGNGHSNPLVSRLLFDIKGSVESGLSLSDSFAKHPDYFDKLFCNLIASGEKAGILDLILDRLATYLEKVQKIKKKVKSALTYPIAIIGVAFIVTAIIMLFVIPAFQEVFAEFGADLPAPTLVVIGISNFFVAYWYLIFSTIAGVIFGTMYAIKKSNKISNIFDAGLLKMPIFGSIFIKSAVARWARTLATMFTAGIPMVEALGAVAGAAGNNVYYEATKKIQSDIATGQSMTYSMTEQKVFPNMLIQMAQIGEESGTMDDMLNKAAEFYEEEVDNTVNSISSLMEPFIITFLGVVVGGLVVAMYLPIFRMAAAV